MCFERARSFCFVVATERVVCLRKLLVKYMPGGLSYKTQTVVSFAYLEWHQNQLLLSRFTTLVCLSCKGRTTTGLKEEELKACRLSRGIFACLDSLNKVLWLSTTSLANPLLNFCPMVWSCWKASHFWTFSTLIELVYPDVFVHRYSLQRTF